MSGDPPLQAAPAGFRYRGPSAIWLQATGAFSVCLNLSFWFGGIYHYYYIFCYSPLPLPTLIVLSVTALPLVVGACLIFYNWIAVTADDSALEIRERDKSERAEYRDIESVVIKEASYYDDVPIPTAMYMHVTLKPDKTPKFALPEKKQRVLVDYLKNHGLHVEEIPGDGKSMLEKLAGEDPSGGKDLKLLKKVFTRLLVIVVASTVVVLISKFYLGINFDEAVSLIIALSVVLVGLVFFVK